MKLSDMIVEHNNIETVKNRERQLNGAQTAPNSSLVLKTKQQTVIFSLVHHILVLF